ncbi:MAG: hypothetical protein JKY15_01890 [Deltaproteobacteria bacterium]|nr:hypothetical protein [Deltaproteobacteria bacterium]
MNSELERLLKIPYHLSLLRNKLGPLCDYGRDLKNLKFLECTTQIKKLEDEEISLQSKLESQLEKAEQRDKIVTKLAELNTTFPKVLKKLEKLTKIKQTAEFVVDEFEAMGALQDHSTFRLIQKIHSLSEALERKK